MIYIVGSHILSNGRAHAHTQTTDPAEYGNSSGIGPLRPTWPGRVSLRWTMLLCGTGKMKQCRNRGRRVERQISHSCCISPCLTSAGLFKGSVWFTDSWHLHCMCHVCVEKMVANTIKVSFTCCCTTILSTKLNVSSELFLWHRV